MGGLSDAIASAARAVGVEIRTDCGVKQINIRDNAKVEGIVLDNGEEIKVGTVASNATASVTFEKLIPNEIAEKNEQIGELKRHMLQIDYTSGTTKINLALSGLP